MPRLSQDMSQGRIVAWLKKEGEAVKEGEPLLSIETDKAEVEVPAPRSGILRRVLLAPGQDAEVGMPLAIVGDADEPIEALLSSAARAVKPPVARPRAETVPAASAVPAPAAGTGAPRRQPVSPAARRVARELGVELSQVSGTGPDGLVMEQDVRTYAARPQPASPGEASENVEVIPLVGLRLRIAERMSLSRRTVADVTTVADVDMTELGNLRKASKLSYTAYVVRATAQALRDFPILNASLVDNQILVKRDIHVGVAIALERGLVVPVIRSADRKSPEEIGREIDELAARGQAGQLGPAELTGSTFTVTNSGAFGSLLFTPIINHPEVAILGMGKVAETPVVRDGSIVIRKIMYLCLSYDHRVVDGAPAVQFLQAVKSRLEQGKA
ncbi:MAG TPA: dihydrolipoamide acetyltransferase family protein [Candidatus Sulfotelmatobacter sp.]|nr:dihydrolipoamide acetyltransferase family protein [Candidatus Sulfotelmatobacter sp.]